MRRLLPSSVLAACLAAACSSFSLNEATPSVDDGGAESSISEGGDGGADVVQPPAGCDPAAEPKDAPKCVDDSFGVFADATSGSDTNPGTKASPVKSIGAALGKLGGKPRVYVCEGTYAEHVKATSAVSVYGGFACGSWSYTGTKAKVAPSDVGYALELDGVVGAVTFADVSLTAAAGTAAARSSLAVSVSGSSNVTFVRAALEGGVGKEGADGAVGETGTPDKSLDGIPASGTMQGAGKTCTCAKSGGTTSGGAGGPASANGQDGAPNLAENPAGQPTPHTGKGGIGATSCIYPGGLGLPGADALNASDAMGVTTLGTLSASGWTAASGVTGMSGVPGQGGGGGGGRNATSAGGGGACGGCGATGGQGGGGGGGSIALVALDSTVVLRASTLTTQAAGSGGKGGGGGAGVVGGFGGPTNGGSVGCGAGDGGKGGNGGTGSGGAGGVSIGAIYKGPKPTLEASAVTTGAFGTKGAGGSPGVNDGIDGQKADTLEIP